MNTIICLSLMLSPQTSPQPPAKSPPGKTQNAPGSQGYISEQQQRNLQNGTLQNGQLPPGGQQNVPGSQGYISQQQQQNLQNGTLQNGQLPLGSFGSMYQMPVDGTYQVLAYEKFGQVLPGMNTLKVVIRNNILTFPGDARVPGKMLQIAFGPANTIMLTPIDNRQDPVRPTTPGTGNIPGGSNPPVGGDAVRNLNNNPLGNIAGQGNNIAQGTIQPTAQSEVGVYVLSNEFFSISVTGKPSTDLNQTGINQTGLNQPGVGGTTATTGGTLGTGPNSVLPGTNRAGANQTGQAGVGGTTATTGGTLGTGPNSVLPGTNRAGANQTTPGTTVPGNTQVPGNGTVQQQPNITTPPGTPNQAVLVLRRVSN